MTRRCLATLLEPVIDPEAVRITTRIDRVEKSADGSVLVHGKVTSDDLDLDDQIIDRDFARKALADWFDTYANVRQMHSTNLPPGGKGVKLDEREDGFYLTSKVVEPGAIKLVNEGVYSAYSIGISRPRIQRDPIAKGGRVTGGIVSEVSLVDFPANPTCTLFLANQENDVQKVLSGDALEKAKKPFEGAAKPFGKDGKRDDFEDEKDSKDDDAKDGGAKDDDANKEADPELAKAAAAWYADFDADLGKRNFDKNTGGGVDRDKIPAEDFAGKNRSFPIVTPGDVSDAASSIGRAGDDNYPADQLKANIIRIAKRKGPKFVAALPDAWKETKKVVESDNMDKVQALIGEAVELAKVGRDAEAMAKRQEAAELVMKASMPSTPTLTELDPSQPLVSAPTPAMTSEPTTATVGPDGQPEQVIPVTKSAEPQETQPVPSGEPAASEPAPADPPARKSLDDYGIGTQHRVRQIHDALCPAYSWDAVTAAHPTLAKNGVAAALGPTASALLFQMLSHEVAEDGGKGVEADDIKHIACAYRDLMEFLGDEAAEAATPMVLQAARDELHKAFSDFYPNVRVSPLTLDAGDASRWNRGYNADGRAPQTGHSTTVDLPNDGSSISAAHFDRGEITAGRADSAAKDASPDLVKDRTYYTRRAQSTARDVMATMHDHIASTFPGICATTPEHGFGVRPDITRGDPARLLGVNPTVPDPSKLDTSGDTKRPATEAIGNRDPRAGGSQPAPEGAQDPHETPLPASGKALTPEMSKALTPMVADLVKASVSEAVAEDKARIAEMSQTIEDLTKRLADLESQPDPAQAPWRGAMGAMAKVLGATQTQQEQAISEVEKAAFDDRRARAEYLTRVANSSTDPGLRFQAREELTKLQGA